VGEVRIGEVRVDCLRDAIAPFAHDTLTYAFPGVALEQWEPYRERYPDTFVGDNWLVRFCGILVRTPTLTMLVDTGLGAKPDPYWGVAEGRLLDALGEAGVAPEDVDVVFHSHLHADHVGWNVTADGQPTFPRAKYVANSIDWSAFHEPLLEKAFPFSYLEEQVFSLERHGVLELIDGEHSFADGLVAVPAYGHTPGHMALAIESGGQRAMICGDAILHPAQVNEPDWPFVFDVDRDHAARTRRELINAIEREGQMLIQCHFPDPGHGFIVRDGDARLWEPA
jgi:glyoxylase-like metal-dependent hydrolase (beta-lactamase superfamily II)